MHGGTSGKLERFLNLKGALMESQSTAKRAVSVTLSSLLALSVCLGGCLLISGCGSEQHSAVWLPTKITHYSSTVDALNYTEETEYDSSGNITHDYVDSAYGQDRELTPSPSYDSDGYLTSCKNADGETITYEDTIVSGRLVSATSSQGQSLAFEYHDNGMWKSISNTSNGVTVTTTFDENGYKTSSSTTGTVNKSSEYEWAFDSNGTPTSVTVTTYDPKIDGNAGPRTFEYTLECDSNGNITKAIDNSNGVTITKEYTEVQHPNTYAWLNGNLKSAGI